MRLRLLGENLIAFRTTSGAVGIVQPTPARTAAPRCSSAATRKKGLRCVYHGWKFDVDGRLRRHAVGAGRVATSRTRCASRAYPTQERSGIVWAYMGPREVAAAAARPRGQHAGRGPRQAAADADGVQLAAGASRATSTRRTWASCTSAPSGPRTRCRGSYDYYTVQGPRAALRRHGRRASARPTRAYRPAEDGGVLLAHRPLHVPVLHDDPDRRLGAVIRGQFWVPLDDDNTMYWGLQVRASRRAVTAPRARRRTAHRAVPLQRRGPWRLHLPAEHDRLARPLAPRPEHGQRLPDRPREAEDAARAGPASAACASRTRPSPRAWARSMNRIQRAPGHVRLDDHPHAQAPAAVPRRPCEQYGEVPPGVDNPEVYRSRSGSIILPPGVDWLTATEHLRKPSVAVGEPVFATTGA